MSITLIPEDASGNIIKVPRADYKNEEEFNVPIFGILKDIIGKELQLVNSERFKFLRTGNDKKYNYKPDFFATADFNVKVKDNGNAHQGISYGEPKSNQLIDYLFEAKFDKTNLNKVLSDSEIGTMASYLMLLHDQNAHPFPRGLLYNPREFILM